VPAPARSDRGHFWHPKVAFVPQRDFCCVGNASQLIHVIKNRLASLIHTCVKGGKLEKYLFYEGDSELISVEDPIFRYYLNHLDIFGFLESLGIPDGTAQEMAAIKDRVLIVQRYLELFFE
jgi:hypothetical protein